METQYDVVIVGAGHGGAQTAIALKRLKFAGSIALVGDEPEPPYERPPLSKEYFSKAKSFDQILIRPIAYWAEQNVALLLGRRVTSVDAERHVIRLADGSTIRYGALVWATGGVPRRLSCPGSQLTGVHAMRTRADTDRIQAASAAAHRIVVIGGGYIGLETAAVLTKLGKHVTVLEAADRVLARVAGEPLSRFYEDEHRAHGVDIHLNAKVKNLVGAEGRVIGVNLGDVVLPADMTIVGIGVEPAVEPVLMAGAAGGDGVSVDSFCRTSLPDVYAIGDCAAHENAFAAVARLRLESVQNATDQASVVAQAIAGRPVPYATMPWFWSNQYDLKLQTVGLSSGYDEILVRGDTSSRSFSLVYLRAGRVSALDCVNNPRDFIQGKAIVGRAAPDRLADAAISIKELAA